MSAIERLRAESGDGAAYGSRCQACGRLTWKPGTPKAARPAGSVKRASGGKCWTCRYGGRAERRSRHEYFPEVVESRERGMSAAEIGRAVGVHMRTVQRWLAEIDAAGGTWPADDRPYYAARRVQRGLPAGGRVRG